MKTDLEEAKLEIERHHQDFERISQIVNEALTQPWAPRPYENVYEYKEALKAVRNIVG